MTRSHKKAKSAQEEPLILGEEVANDVLSEESVPDGFAQDDPAMHDFDDDDEIISQTQLIEDLTQKVAELEDQNLRYVAELDNLRRRFERERADSIRYAVMPLAKEILPSIDNLERAVRASANVQTPNEQLLETLSQGVKMTVDTLQENLATCHIKRVGALGETFDPNLHQVISEIPATNGEAANSIIQIMQYGYRLHDRLIRPAMVMIAKA